MLLRVWVDIPASRPFPQLQDWKRRDTQRKYICVCCIMPSPPLESQAAPGPHVEFPSSSNTVIVRVIDTTTRIYMPIDNMFEPAIKGHTRLSSPSYSFLVESESLGRKVVFDLGTQKEWREQAPSVVSMIDENGWDVRVEKDVAGILQEHGVSLDSVEAIIWR